MQFSQTGTMESHLNRQGALDIINQLSKPGLTREEMLALYHNWSDYDKDAEALADQGPEQVAQAISQHFQGNEDTYILDIGAGTGQLAQELKKVGFTNIDAVDPNQTHLKIAKAKGLYKKYLNMFFTDNMECIKTSTYDAVVLGESIGESHVELNTFPEMIRCVKPGGLVVIAMSDEDLNNDCTCKDKIEPYIELLQNQGLWKLVVKTFIPDYTNEYPGYLFVIEITKSA